MSPMRSLAGTKQWGRIRTVVMGPAPGGLDEDTVLVVTPLDLIMHLEAQDSVVSRVVIAGVVAQRELGSFLKEQYPAIDVVEH